jgi:hypothetical protein
MNRNMSRANIDQQEYVVGLEPAAVEPDLLGWTSGGVQI